MAKRRPLRTALAFQDDPELLWNRTGQRDALLDQMRAGGGKRVRVNVIYGDTKRHGYGEYDALVNAARARGLRVNFTLMGDPSYATDSRQSALSAYNPNQYEMGKFAKDVAQHFRGRVNRYSIWNEPNLALFLNAKRPARTYRRLWDQGSYAIRHNDPGARVAMGEFAPSNGRNHSGDALRFLRRTIGRRPVMADSIAFHPYGGNPDRRLGRVKREQGRIENLGHMQEVIRRLHRRGLLASKTGHAPKMSLTEFGYMRDRPGLPGLSDAQRLRYMRAAMRKARRYRADELVQYQVTPKAAGNWWDTSLPIPWVAAMTRR